MAETQEVVEQTEEQAAASFASGFEPVTPQPGAVAEPPTAAVEDKPVEEASPVAEPEYVQITKGDLARLNAAAEETAGIKQQLSKAFGTMGNMQQLINQVRSQTPAGAAVEITDDDFAELKEDFPELAGHTRAALERILKRTNLTGTGTASQTMDPEQVRVAAANVVHSEGLRDLDDLHPGWRDIVGKPDDDNAYRQWLATQPTAYQDLVRTTYSASITSRSIDRFKAATAEKPKPAARPQTPARPDAARRDRIQAAVQPRGNGSAPVPHSPTPADNFRAGFES